MVRQDFVELGCDDPEMIDDDDGDTKVGGEMPQQSGISIKAAG